MTFSIEMHRGDTYDNIIRLLTDDDYVVIPDNLTFTVRKRYTDQRAYLQKTLSDGGVFCIDKDKNLYGLHLDPADTVDMIPGEYVADFELSAGGTLVRTYRGAFKLYADVTHGRSNV